MNEVSTYVPGMCNINKAEIAYRRRAMWFGIVLTVILLIIALVLDLQWWLGIILLFVPTYIAAIGHLQVRNRFCVAYGSSGKQNAMDGSESASDVTDSEALAADKRKVRTMNVRASIITIIVLAASGLLLALI